MDDKGIDACQWQCLRHEDIVALTSGDELLLSDDLGPIFVVLSILSFAVVLF